MLGKVILLEELQNFLWVFNLRCQRSVFGRPHLPRLSEGIEASELGELMGGAVP